MTLSWGSADSLYGESKVNFVDVLDELKLPYMLAIRSNHALWLPQEQDVYTEAWQQFERTFSNGTTEVRYMAEVIYGKRRHKRYWLLTTDPETLPVSSTSFVMMAAPAVKLTEIGNSYGFRTWIEYGLKQAKDARLLGRLSHDPLRTDRKVVGDGDECIFDGESVR